MNDVAFDPRSEGTGYGARQLNFANPAPGEAVWETTDSGESWSPIGIPGIEANGYCVTVDPVSDSVIYAGTTAGIHLSGDGGASWIDLHVGRPVLSIAVCPDSNKILFASAPRTGGGELALTLPTVATAQQLGSELLRSRNGGQNWETLPLAGIFITNVLVDSLSPRSVYATGYPDSLRGSLNHLQLYRSTDRGNTWETIWEPPGLGLNALDPWHNGFAIDPSNDLTLFVGTLLGLYASSDGGESFEVTGVPISTYRLAPSALTPGRILCSWVNRMFGGVGSEGLIFLKESEASPWRPQGEWPLAVIRYHPLRPGEVVMSSYTRGVFRSTDDGVTWQDISWPEERALYDVQFDPGAPGNLYAVHGDALTFPPQPPQLTRYVERIGWEVVWQPGEAISCLALHPTSSETLFVGLAGRALMRSTDGGSTWEAFDYFTDIAVTAIAVKAQDPDEICIGTAGEGLHMSTDAGISWFQADFPETTTISSVVYGPRRYPYIFVGTRGSGVWWSPSAAEPFAALSEGLESQEVWHLIPDPLDDAVLFAATSRGAFEMDLASLGIGAHRDRGVDQGIPASGSRQETLVRLTVFSLRGQRIRTLVERERGGGRYEVVWDGADASGKPVPSGVYFAQLECEGRVSTKKILLLR